MAKKRIKRILGVERGKFPEYFRGWTDFNFRVNFGFVKVYIVILKIADQLIRFQYLA